LAKRAFLGMLAAFAPHLASAADDAAPVVDRLQRASFAREQPSRDARQVADWVLDSADNHGLPFVIVDKVRARVFVFDALGKLRGAAAALLGLGRGDEAIPGIGDMPLASIRPKDRTTPAGRFVASLDRNLQGKEILWVDYDTAVSMHPVATGKPQERRAQRLATPTPSDNRISYGCINVPAKFFKEVVRATFAGTEGIVYVLPETRPVRAAFGPKASEPAQQRTAPARAERRSEVRD
jgi:hypothetical protein